VLLALLVLGGSTAFAPAPFPRHGKSSIKGDLASLQGVWTVTRSRPGISDDLPVPTLKVKIEGSKWTFLRDGPQGRVSSITYEITLDTKHNPPHIDITRTLRGGSPPVTSMRGILRVVGNKVQILYVTGSVAARNDFPGGRAGGLRAGGTSRRATTARPKSFDSPPSRAFLLTLTRGK
jgi:uncharacterized protein (TIGR03067 family)